ncbi:2OG-Fe(II) oxygenase [Aquirhabdus sp.]|uniref:2OG-Fe(II) oxygenase n=1 Tax=Aquirhabdus sp. TaxID=2824160 RepID=UPI00396C30F3
MGSADQAWVDQLPVEWQSWLVENLERGCDPGEIGRILHENGFKFTDKGLSLQSTTDKKSPDSNQKMQDFNLDHLASGNNFLEVQGQVIRLLGHFENPAIFYFEDMLSPQECDELIHLSEQEGKLARSTVVDNKDGSLQLDQRRSSDSTFFNRGENPLVSKIEQRIAALVNWPVTHGEGLQILRYQHGGEYHPHFDFFDPKYEGSAKHLAIGGQRVASFILYLSDIAAGGGTRFPNIGLEFRPKKGAALLFANTDRHGKPHNNSLHAGMPVIEGTKYIATKWLRERQYGKS